MAWNERLLQNDRVIKLQRDRIEELENALRRYTHCRHSGGIGCVCTRDAKAALKEDPKEAAAGVAGKP